MKKLIVLSLCLIAFSQPSFAGSGSFCNPKDSRKHFEAEVKQELCVSKKEEYVSDPMLSVVTVRGYGKPYPNCKDFGMIDYVREYDFWGKPKCDPACQATIGLLFTEARRESCKK